MKKRVLLSIHPEFAEAILDGRKQYEFRRAVFKQDIDEILVYATLPIARVIGSFKVAAIYEGPPNKIWAETKLLAGVSKARFDLYFKDRSRAFAIQVSRPKRFIKPVSLSRFLASNCPPQSFCYV